MDDAILSKKETFVFHPGKGGIFHGETGGNRRMAVSFISSLYLGISS